VGPVKRAPKELSPSEKFVIKQAANRAAKIAGDAISARGVYTLLNPTSAITTVITGRYVPQSTITANEAFLSESKRQADLKSAKQRNVKLTVKGKPSPGKRYKSTTKFVRADRTARGKIRVTPKGRDFLHTIETTPEREKRLARSRNLSKATIIGGRSLRFGVPALIVGWTLYDVFSGDAPKKTREESLVYGLGGWVLQDASALATIAYTGHTTSLLTAGSFQWSDLIG
jgi:hypothetical protein